MSTDRPDIHTRFKKGQSGNPNGRPKGRRNEGIQIRDVLLKPIRIKDGTGVRTVPKIVAAIEVCLNKALTGDMRALEKMIRLAERMDAIQWLPPIPEITHITRTIVYPKDSSVDENRNEKPLRGLSTC
jgi:hypothetical protein